MPPRLSVACPDRAPTGPTVPQPCPDRPDRARPGANPGDLRDPFGLLRSEDAPLASGCLTDPDIDMMLRDLVLASLNFLKLALSDSSTPPDVEEDPDGLTDWVLGDPDGPDWTLGRRRGPPPVQLAPQ